MAQQTAVEWLQNELLRLEMLDGYAMFEIFEKAKEIEKEQIMKAVDRGYDEGCKFPEDMTLRNSEQYYNETYGS